MTNHPSDPSPYSPPPGSPGPGSHRTNGFPEYPYGPGSTYAQKKAASAGGSRTPLIIIGVLVLLIVMAGLALFALRSLTDAAGTTGAQSEAVGLSELVLDEPDSGAAGSVPDPLDAPPAPSGLSSSAEDGSLPPQFSGLTPAPTEQAAAQCRTELLAIHPEDGLSYEVEAARCLLAGAPTINDRPIEFLTDAGWSGYVDALLQGTVRGYDVQLLNEGGTVSVGVSRGPVDDAVTLHYVDTGTQLAVEIIGLEDPSEAAQVALELGWL